MRKKNAARVEAKRVRAIERARNQPIDNCAGLQQDYVNAIHQAYAATVLKYGEDIASKEQAAAHEAGHVVVAYAIGERIDEARVYRHPHPTREVWIGSNHCFCADVDPNRVFQVRDDPVTAFRMVVNNSAGYMGEKIARLDHPSSSVDERMKAEYVGRALDDTWRRPATFAVEKAQRLCRIVLEKNRAQFDAIREHLCATERLSSSDAARMLATAQVQPLAEIMKAIAP